MKHRHGAVWFAPVLSVLVAVLVAVVVAGVANAIPFSPTQKITVADPTAGTDSDYTAQYDIPKGDALFAYQATFTPPEFGVDKDADVPNGAMVGRLTSTSTLGLINQPCTTSLVTLFDLMDASTNTSDTVAFADTFADADGNTLPDGVDKYPEMLTRMFPGLTPRARYFGMANVGGSAVSLNFVIFEPGSDLPGIGARAPSASPPCWTSPAGGCARWMWPTSDSRSLTSSWWALAWTTLRTTATSAMSACWRKPLRPRPGPRCADQAFGSDGVKRCPPHFGVVGQVPDP